MQLYFVDHLGDLVKMLEYREATLNAKRANYEALGIQDTSSAEEIFLSPTSAVCMSPPDKRGGVFRPDIEKLGEKTVSDTSKSARESIEPVQG